MKNKKILIVSAHIDDETFGMGGTIYDLVKDNEVMILVLCRGQVFNDINKARSEILENYKDIGVKIKILDNFDLYLENHTLRSLIEDINREVLNFNTNIIFTHSKDSHPDHNMISEAVDVIARLKNNIEKLYHFSIPGNSEWSRSNFKPNIFNEISNNGAFFKYQLIKEYNILLDIHNPNPLSLDKVIAKDSYIGSLGNCENAEAFQLVLSSKL